MNSSITKDTRSSNWQELHRKVKPKLLASDLEISPRARGAVKTGLEVFSGDWNAAEAAHLLKRTLFGSKKLELNVFTALGLDGAIEQLLQLDPDPAPPVNNYNYAEDDIEDPDVASGETWIEAPYRNEYESYRIISLKGWMLKNWINQPLTIHEKMILFWHNLLPTQIWDVFVSKASYQYVLLLRRNALGNFKTLIKELTLDPSMLLYLNGAFNRKEAPDENFARELQELFCIGKGENAKFTEADVQAAARVLTGWTIDWETLDNAGVVATRFEPYFHETADKTFSSFYGNTTIIGREEESGAEELDDLLDMIFDNDETAMYLCRRLYNFFVYSEIDAEAEVNVITPLAQILRDNNYEIAPVLEVLFKSAHFYDSLNKGALIKNPADFLLGIWKTLEVPDPTEGDLYREYRMYSSMLWTMAEQGMEIGDPPSVSGWPAYYQAPQFDRYWITTDTISSRAIRTDSLVYWGFWIMPELTQAADFIVFLEGLDHPEDPNLMLSEATELLLGLTLSGERLDSLKSILLSGQQTDGYWTTAWQLYQNDTSNEENRLILENRLKPTFQNIMQLGECQLM